MGMEMVETILGFTLPTLLGMYERGRPDSRSSPSLGGTGVYCCESGACPDSNQECETRKTKKQDLPFIGAGAIASKFRSYST